MLLWHRAVRCAWVMSLSCSVFVQLAQAQAPDVSAVPSPLPAGNTDDASPIADPLLDQVEEAIRVNSQRFLTANYHSPWQIFHGIVAYRRDFQLKVGEQKMSAIDWIATADPKFDNRSLILVTQHGAKFHPYTRPYAFEGHPSQTLALLSESHLPTDFSFRVNNQTVTIEQMLQNSMMEVNTREETTWVLWALINYLKVDASWTNQWGQAWSMESLVRNEVAAHTPTRPCGGNHNLFVLSRARDKYLATGRPLRGAWFEADQKIRQFIEYARSMQNSDGSFSSNFYKGPGYERDMNKRFNSTGHTMEFLAVGLPQERLNEPWVRNAVDVLSRELITHRKAPVDCGPLYHSINSLIIYRDRVRPQRPSVVAETAHVPQPSTSTAAAPMPAKSDAISAATISTGQPAKTTEVVEVVPSATQPLKSVTEPATQPTLDPTAPRLPRDAPSLVIPQIRGPVSALDTVNRR